MDHKTDEASTVQTEMEMGSQVQHETFVHLGQLRYSLDIEPLKVSGHGDVQKMEPQVVSVLRMKTSVAMEVKITLLSNVMMEIIKMVTDVVLHVKMSLQDHVEEHMETLFIQTVHRALLLKANQDFVAQERQPLSTG